jgi:hypothetical protein
MMEKRQDLRGARGKARQTATARIFPKIVRKKHKVLLTLIALSLSFSHLGCKESSMVELPAPSIDGERLSESELHEGIRAFYDTVYGVKQIEIKVASERIKTEQNQKAFKVLSMQTEL